MVRFAPATLDERLPWDHIDMLIPKKWFQEDWQRAMELKHAQDCRAGKCHLCGVIYRERELCKHMLKRQKRGRIEEKDWQPTPLPKYEEPEAVQRVRFRIGRTGEARFLSHLELVNAWVRTLRRARTPLSYSQGFHAHPKVTFATAPPVGEESLGDYMDVVLKERVEPNELLQRIRATLPEGFRAFEAEEVPLKAPALMACTTGFAYTIYSSADPVTLQERIEEIMGAPEIVVERSGKAKKMRGRKRPAPRIEVDIRPMIRRLELIDSGEHQAVVDLEVELVGGRSVRMRELLPLLGLDAQSTKVLKRDTFLANENARVEATATA